MVSITFSNKLPNKGHGILLNYKHSPLEAKGWETIDARHIIAKFEDDWLNYVYKWHGHLQRKLYLSCDWFSLFPISRLILWPTTTSFSLKPLFYTLAILKILETRQKSIWVVGSDKYVKQYILEWSKKANVPIFDHCLENYFSSFINKIKTLCIQKIFPFKEFLKLAYCLGFYPKRKIIPAHIVVSSLFMSEDLIDKIGDHYYGFLFDNNKVVSKKNVCWIYNDLRIDRKNARKKLDKIGRSHYFLSDFFTWRDLFSAFIDAKNTSKNFREFYNEAGVPKIRFNEFESIKFSQSYFINLGLNCFPIFEFLIFRIYKNAFKLLNPKKFVYPYEERPFERAMLIATERVEKNIFSIGYAHAAYSKGHMYLKRHHGVRLPSPSVIAVTGKVAEKRFIFEGFNEKLIFVVGSPRFDIACKRSTPKKSGELNSKLCLLFICGLGYEMINFANLLVNNPDLAISYNIAIRRSFHSWKNEQDEAEMLLKKNKILYKCADSALLEEIDEADIILFESTSSSFQASLMGKLIIQIQMSDVLNTNFFKNHQDMDPMLHCKSPNELKKKLKYINNLSKKKYQELLNKQRLKISSIYNPLNIHKLKKYLS